jgi:hypothetical protein
MRVGPLILVRRADGCEGAHDLVDARFKPGDLERFLKKRERGRVLTHRLVMIDAPPLRIHRDLCAVRDAGWQKLSPAPDGLKPP